MGARHNAAASASSLQTSRCEVAGTILCRSCPAWLSSRSTTQPTVSSAWLLVNLFSSSPHLDWQWHFRWSGCRNSVSHWFHPASRHCEDDPHREDCCGACRCVCAAWIHTDWTVPLLRGGVRRPERGITGSSGAAASFLREPWIIAADWQMTPAELQKTNWPRAVGGVICCCPHATCAMSNCSRTIDHFMDSIDSFRCVMAHPGLTPGVSPIIRNQSTPACANWCTASKVAPGRPQAANVCSCPSRLDFCMGAHS